MKRLLDIVAALVGLILLLPLLLVLCALVWLQDRRSPFYIPNRVGRDGRLFRMIKLRSMIVRADKSKVDSTANNDPRITAIGRFIRRFKFDEIPQLCNVLVGTMSLVGPRPNVSRETDLYTNEEKRLLTVRPGITDIASIVFADESSILEGRSDPDLAYNQLIRPYKSRFGLLYIENSNVLLDIRLVILTLLGSLNRAAALRHVAELVRALGASEDLVVIAGRSCELEPAPPPGSDSVVTARIV